MAINCRTCVFFSNTSETWKTSSLKYRKATSVRIPSVLFRVCWAIFHREGTMQSFFSKVWEIRQKERVPSVLFELFSVLNASPAHRKSRLRSRHDFRRQKQFFNTKVYGSPCLEPSTLRCLVCHEVDALDRSTTTVRSLLSFFFHFTKSLN